jgi:hypothetical protein
MSGYPPSLLQPAAVGPVLSAMRFMRHVAARGKGETRNSRWSLIGGDPLREGPKILYSTESTFPSFAEPQANTVSLPPSVFFPCFLDGAPQYCPIFLSLSCQLWLGDHVGLGCTFSSRLSFWRFSCFLWWGFMM